MAGTWYSLTNQPSFDTGTMILLTDGRVMVHEEGTAHWHALTPDNNGSYLNGSWSDLADMSFWRRYFVSAVLKDGRVLVVGGEQTGDVGDTNKGEIYDPTSDTWKTISTPSWTQVGDAASCVLPDGRVMIGALLSGACLIYDPATDTWSSAASATGRTNEETWVLLPDNTILTAQTWSPFNSEKYIIASNTWKSEGSLPVTLVDPVMNEIGPGMLLYNGKVIYFGSASSGGHGKTAIYTPPALPTGTGTWTAGPNIPTVGGQVMVSNDCPATLMPNGKVLFTAANFANNSWGSPVRFFEYDPSLNSIAQAPTPSNNGTFPYTNSPGIYWSRLMLLPDGNVLFSASSNNVQCYIPDSGPQEAWRPTISSVTPHMLLWFIPPTYVLQGTQLNGLSQANMYGDDCYPATNYPIVQLTSTFSGAVYYARTFHFSTMGVATGSALQSTEFSVFGIPDGTYDLRVIANGIASHPVGFQVRRMQKPEFLDVRLKREIEIEGKLIYEGDPFDRREWGVDPEIGELQMQVKLLQNSVTRLTSLIRARELPRVGKGVAKQAHDEVVKKTSSRRKKS